MIKKTLFVLSAVAFVVAGAALAHQASVKRTPLQKAEFPEDFVSVSGIAEVPAGGAAGRHTHPGVELGYILEGPISLSREGRTST
jgi:quercetin dioxygenase-like cupin family protein